ncbi:MAG: RDD family protein [Pseudomonadales bacterium]
MQEQPDSKEVRQAAGTSMLDETFDAPVYAGFWVRVGAALIDSILLLLVVGPLLTMVYGRDYWVSEAAFHGSMDALLNWILPAIAIILFWYYKSATPGKMIFDLRIVDAQTGGKPSKGQLIGRYFAYYVSTIPLGLGLIWVAFDKRKQGWHDKLAGTVVIKDADDSSEL